MCCVKSENDQREIRMKNMSPTEEERDVRLGKTNNAEGMYMCACACVYVCVSVCMSLCVSVCLCERARTHKYRWRGVPERDGQDKQSWTETARGASYLSHVSLHVSPVFLPPSPRHSPVYLCSVSARSRSFTSRGLIDLFSFLALVIAAQMPQQHSLTPSPQ